RLACERHHHLSQARRPAGHRVAARVDALAAAPGDPGDRDARVAPGRGQRLSDVASVRHPGRPRRGEPGAFDSTRRPDDATDPRPDWGRVELARYGVASLASTD